VAAIWAIIWLSPRSMPSPMLAELATIGSMSGRHWVRAAIVSAERFTATTDASIETPSSESTWRATRGASSSSRCRSIGSGLGSLSSPRAMFSASCVAVVNQASGPCWPSMEKMSPNMPPKGLSLIDTI